MVLSCSAPLRPIRLPGHQATRPEPLVHTKCNHGLCPLTSKYKGTRRRNKWSSLQRTHSAGRRDSAGEVQSVAKDLKTGPQNVPLPPLIDRSLVLSRCGISDDQGTSCVYRLSTDLGRRSL